MKRLLTAFAMILVLLVGCSSDKDDDTKEITEIEWDKFVESYNDYAEVNGLNKLSQDNSKLFVNNLVTLEEDGKITNIYQTPIGNINEAKVLLKGLTGVVDGEDNDEIQSLLNGMDDVLTEDSMYFQKVELEAIDVIINAKGHENIAITITTR